MSETRVVSLEQLGLNWHAEAHPESNVEDGVKRDLCVCVEVFLMFHTSTNNDYTSELCRKMYTVQDLWLVRMGCLCFPPCVLMWVEAVVSVDNIDKVEEMHSDLFSTACQVYILWCCKVIFSANWLNYCPSAAPEAGLLENLSKEAYSWLRSFPLFLRRHPNHPSEFKNLKLLAAGHKLFDPSLMLKLTLSRISPLNDSKLTGERNLSAAQEKLELPVECHIVFAAFLPGAHLYPRWCVFLSLYSKCMSVWVNMGGHDPTLERLLWVICCRWRWACGLEFWHGLTGDLIVATVPYLLVLCCSSEMETSPFLMIS